MSRDPNLRLADIVESCTRIAAYIEGLDAAAFAQDLKTQDAVIRQFEIIGEAVKALPRELVAQDLSIPWTQIAGFRDVLAHSYFAVDTSVIWDAASQKAPPLKVSCDKLLCL
jgi:uncharacterized protein with HEPN domain